MVSSLPIVEENPLSGKFFGGTGKTRTSKARDLEFRRRTPRLQSLGAPYWN